jgi:hypothetical protein
MKDIPGTIFSPCFMTEEEYEEGYKQSVFYVEKDYMEEYRKHMVAMEHIANIAKTYILKNWKGVTDWSGLEVTITHGPTGEKTEYYNYVESDRSGKMSETMRKVFERIDERNRAKHNPIREFNEVVLDPTDGDFSITVNGDVQHWWISDDEVIIIADYIEKQLSKDC